MSTLSPRWHPDSNIPLLFCLNALYFPDEGSFVAVLKRSFVLQAPASVRIFMCFVHVSGQKIDILGCVQCFDHLNTIHMVLSKDCQTIQLSICDLLNLCVIVWNRHAVE